MNTGPDISIIFSTYNRCDYVRQTLEAMCDLDCEGLNGEFVVVDNNSTDETGQVIDSFAERLPIRHLFEPRPGKNCALNHALDTVALGKIVVFTDDDVVPQRDWLKQIAAACERWPEYDVFGGKIELIWPEGVTIPKWASENVMIRGMGFAEHDLGTETKPYLRHSIPSGPNFWVRAGVFRERVRYDESIGPRPGKQFGMGSESELLHRLVSEGANPLYAPGAVVGHHVQASLLHSRNMLRRAVRYGRGAPHTAGLPDPDKWIKHPWRWRLRRLGGTMWHLVLFCCAQLHRDQHLRMQNAVEALRNYAYHREALSMSWGSSRTRDPMNRTHSSIHDCVTADDTDQSRGRVRGG